MIKNCRIFDYLLITLSIISIIYFIILVINSRFITAYFIYPIFSIITGFYSFYELKNKVSIKITITVITNAINVIPAFFSLFSLK